MLQILSQHNAPENTYFVCGLVDSPDGAYLLKNRHGRK